MQTTKFPIRLTIAKSKEMIYFSQLDLIHVLERALRRSALPVYYTQGFNPHVKISFLTGLKLGIEGEVTVRLYFTQPVSRDELSQALSVHLPEGLLVQAVDAENKRGQS